MTPNVSPTVSPIPSPMGEPEEEALLDPPGPDIIKLLAPLQEDYNHQSRLKAVGLVLMLLGLGGSGVLLGRALDTRSLTGNLLELFCQPLQEYDPSVLICNMMNITDALYTPKVALFTSGAAVPGVMIYGTCLHSYFLSRSPTIVTEEDHEAKVLELLKQDGGKPGPPVFKIFLMAMASYASGMAEGVASHLLEIGQNFEKYCPPYNPLNRTNSNSSELLCNITKTPEVVPGVLKNARELYLFGGALPFFILGFSVVLYCIYCQRKWKLT